MKMPEKMKAMMLVEPKRFELQDVPVPKAGPGDVVFKVIYAGVCGSDFPIYKSGMFVPSLPQIIGHEFSGIVTETGKEVEGIAVGDRIMGTNIEWCGECEYCKAGNHWSCPYISVKGLGFGVPGVFAEYGKINHAMLGISVHKLPDTANDLQLALAEPMCVGAGNVPAVDVQPGDRVVIFGAGIIGESHMQYIKKIPDTQVVMIDYSQKRLDIAKKLGADYIINPAVDGDALQGVIKIWGDAIFAYNYEPNSCGRADVVFECSGNAKAFTQAFQIVKPFGKVCIAGTCETMAEIHPQWIELKGVKIYAGLNGNFAESVRRIGTGEIQVTDLITHVYPLEQLEEAFQMAMNSKESLKVVIKVDKTAPDYPYNRQEK